MIRFFAIALLFFSLMVPTSFANAETANTCDCFCRTESGAKEIAVVDGFESCKTECKDRKDSILGCYTEATKESRPENNKLCWTAQGCEADEKLIDTGATEASIWGGQADSCLSGEGFCYNPPGYISDGQSSNVTLGVQIGDLKESRGLQDYVPALYDFLLIAGSILAVVLVMVAGVQWMTARGNAGAIGKAKERLGSAVFGLVLLLAAVTIGELIDPSLTKFGSLSIPKVRQINYINKSAGCLALSKRTDVTIKMVNATGITCGDKAVIESIVDGNGQSVTSIEGLKVGETCDYLECTNSAEECFQDVSGQFSCYSCVDIFEGGKIPPSNGICESLNNRELNDGSKTSCHMLDASAAGITNTDMCLDVYYKPGDTGLDCTVLENDYGDLGCKAYEYLNLRGSLVAGEYGFDRYLSVYNPLFDVVNHSEYEKIFKEICEKDVCGIAKNNNGSCESKWDVVRFLCKDVGF